MADLRDAIANALRGDGDSEPGTDTEDEGTASAETTSDDGAASSSTEGDETDADEDDGDTSSEGEDSDGKSEATEDDVPTEYFGTDLSGLDAKERADIVRAFQERDRHIQQLLREKAEASKSEGDEPEDDGQKSTDQGGDVSDEDILRELGLDPENNPDDAIAAKVALPLARLYLQTQGEVQELKQSDSVRETKVLWETTLTALEAQYGTLPADISHDDLMREAAKAGISEPIDAYWRVMGPARHDIIEEVKKRRDAATRQLASKQQTLKPKTSEKTADEDPLKGITDVRPAIETALRSLAEEKGWDLENADLFE